MVNTKNIVKKGVSDIMNEHISECTKSLSEKYSFNYEEAMEYLASIRENKNKKETKKVDKEVVEVKETKKVDKEVVEVKETKKVDKVKESKSKGKKEDDKQDKKEQDKKERKKSTTGYLQFSSSNRVSVRSELESKLGEGEKVKPQEILKILGERWKELTEEERKEWNDKASVLNNDE